MQPANTSTPHYVTTIGNADVGRTVLRRGDTYYHVNRLLGRVGKRDVGTALYSDAVGLLSIESAAQCEVRLEAKREELRRAYDAR